MIGITFRQYLDKTCLTPFEVLHSLREFKRLVDQKPVVDAALGRIAALQARIPGHDLRGRRTLLNALVEAALLHGRTAEAALSEFPRTGSILGGWLDTNPGGPEAPAAADGGLRSAICRDLVGLRSWSAKLEHVLGLIWRHQDPRVAAAVDEVVADLMGTPAALKELLNAPPNIGTKLVRLFELISGESAMAASPTGIGRSGTLNALFRQNRLPQAFAAGVDRIRRRLKSTDPLIPGSRSGEAETFKILLDGMVSEYGVLGGGGIAEALIIRYARRLEQGGSAGLRRAIVAVGEAIGDLTGRLQFLLALAESETGSSQINEVVGSIEAALGNERLVEALVLRSTDLGRVRAMTRSIGEALKTSSLTGPIQSRIQRKLANMVDEFVLSGNLLERLDELEPAPGKRALRLTELVESGLIHDDGALPVIRRRLVEMLKQPGFDTDLAVARAGRGTAAQTRLPWTTAANPAPTIDDAAARPAAPVRAAGKAAPAAALDARTMTVMAPPDAVAPANREIAFGETLAIAHALPVAVVTRPQVRCPACFGPNASTGACPSCGYAPATTARSGPHLIPGTALLDRYEIGRLLGQGGFGATYLAWDDRLQVKVAVKEYFPVSLVSRVPGSCNVVPYTDEHGQHFSNGIGKFLEEARVLARLRDIKEIVGVQDYFETNATAYLVMELLQGRTLKKYLADTGGAVEFRRALAILMPIMKALHAVHETGLVHRDISPDNIFITATGERKLLDFGAARQAIGESAGLMTVILKPGYAPPEQYFQDSRQGPWSDVYALAATLYCLITGKPPPDATRRLQDDAVPPPSSLGINVTPEFEAVLTAALSLKAQERPQSMKALLAAFSKAIG